MSDISPEIDFQFGKYSTINGRLLKTEYQPICSGSTCRFNYPCTVSFSCTPIKLDLKVGRYYFEVYGAAGGHYISTQGYEGNLDYDGYFGYGGFGGYAAMQVSLSQKISLYLYIGG